MSLANCKKCGKLFMKKNRDDILTVKCVRCGCEFKPGRKTGFICDNCLKKLKI